MLAPAVLVAALVAIGGTPADEASMKHLVEAVRRGDYAAQNQAMAMGPAVGTVLTPLLADPDPEVRLLTLHCLQAAEASGTRDAAAAMLTDADEAVRQAARRMLDGSPDESVRDRVVNAIRVTRDDAERDLLVRLLGRIPKTRPEDVGALCRERTSSSCPLVLARLGDPSARTAVRASIGTAPDPGVLVDDLAYLVEGVEPRWLIGPLALLLDDRRDARFLHEAWGNGWSDTSTLRVCDVAVGLLAGLGVTPGFPTGGAARYDDAQLAEVRRVARTAQP